MSDDRSQKITRAIDALARKLPEGTQLVWADVPEAQALVVSASQPHPQADRAYRAAVRILSTAEADDGLGPTLADALRVLQHLARSRSLPVTHLGEPAPVVAIRTSTGTEQQDPPLRFPYQR